MMEIGTAKRFFDFRGKDYNYIQMEKLTEEDIIHYLSTCIFDCYNGEVSTMVYCLKSIQKKFPEYYIFAMEGFLVGDHDT